MRKKDFNLIEHKLVSKHEILNKEDVVKLFSKFKIDGKKLPRILCNDPIVEALGAKIGDIIKIERISETAGRAIYYRIVVG